MGTEHGNEGKEAGGTAAAATNTGNVRGSETREVVALSTIPASQHFAPRLRDRAVDVFGEDGAWLLLSQVWYGWRTYYDLACGLLGDPWPATSARDRSPKLPTGYRVAVDLQVQAHLYAAAEQFATLVRAMLHHEPRTDAFFRAYVDAPADFREIIDDVAEVTREQLLGLIGDPATAQPPQNGGGLALDAASMDTVNVGGLEVPRRILEGEAFARLVERAHTLVDLTIDNLGQLRQFVDPPHPIPGADRQPQALRAVDNSFRHGLRVLFHEGSPTTRTFRVGATSEPPPGVDLYLPGRGKSASDAINFATVSCTIERTQGHLEALGHLSLRVGQLLRAFVGFQTTGTVDLLLSAAHLDLADSTPEATA